MEGGRGGRREEGEGEASTGTAGTRYTVPVVPVPILYIRCLRGTRYEYWLSYGTVPGTQYLYCACSPPGPAAQPYIGAGRVPYLTLYLVQ